METIEPTIEFMDAICRDCKTSFKAQAFRFSPTSTPMTQARCESCLEAAKQAEADALKVQAQKQKAAHEAGWEKICPWEFRLTTENGNTDLSRLMVEQPKVMELLAWKYSRRGIVIRSKDSGRCKTRAMFRLLRRLWEDGKSIAVMSAGDFDRQARDAGGNFSLTAWFDGLKSVDVFCLDDLGKGQWSPATEALFFELVDKRTIDGKPLLITTNETGESLLSLLSVGRARPLIRRLRDYCEQMQF